MNDAAPLPLAMRIVLGSLGVICLATAGLLYPDERNKVQNSLEKWWIDFDDAADIAISRDAVFARFVATRALDSLRWFFGERLFAVHAVAVSIGLSSASVWIWETAAALVFPAESEPETGPWWTLICLVHAGIFAALTWKSIGSTRWAKVTIAVGFLFFPLYLLLEPFLWSDEDPLWELLVTGAINGLYEGMAVNLAIVFGVVSMLAYIAISRRLLTLAAGLETLPAILAVVLWNLAVAVILIGVPVAASLIIESLFVAFNVPPAGELTLIGDVLALAFQRNLVILIPASLYIVFALAMLLHRLMWPLLCRLIYLVQDIGILQRRKLLASTGVVLVMAALPGTKDWLESLIFPG